MGCMDLRDGFSLGEESQFVHAGVGFKLGMKE
jgi:hypothetical protein